MNVKFFKFVDLKIIFDILFSKKYIMVQGSTKIIAYNAFRIAEKNFVKSNSEIPKKRDDVKLKKQYNAKYNGQCAGNTKNNERCRNFITTPAGDGNEYCTHHEPPPSVIRKYLKEINNEEYEEDSFVVSDNDEFSMMTCEEEYQIDDINSDIILKEITENTKKCHVEIRYENITTKSVSCGNETKTTTKNKRKRVIYSSEEPSEDESEKTKRQKIN